MLFKHLQGHHHNLPRLSSPRCTKFLPRARGRGVVAIASGSPSRLVPGCRWTDGEFTIENYGFIVKKLGRRLIRCPVKGCRFQFH